MKGHVSPICPMNPALSEASPFRSREEKLSERHRKREAVLRAAVRTFNARGFHAASLDDVASSLNISKPTIYHYLGNKEQVLLECVTRGLTMLEQAADAAKRESGTGLDRLRSFLRRYAEINMDDFGRCVIRTGDEMLSADGATRFRELKSRIDHAMRGLIDDAMADGSIEPTDVKLLAFTLAGALNWPARWHRPDGALAADAISATMVDMLTAGLAPRGAPTSIG